MHAFFNPQSRNAYATVPSAGELLETGAPPGQTENEQLEQEVHRLSLVSEALWMLLKERFHVTDDELINYANEIDMTNGHIGGNVCRPPITCQHCGRKTPKSVSTCLYCGASVFHHPFDVD